MRDTLENWIPACAGMTRVAALRPHGFIRMGEWAFMKTQDDKKRKLLGPPCRLRIAKVNSFRFFSFRFAIGHGGVYERNEPARVKSTPAQAFSVFSVSNLLLRPRIHAQHPRFRFAAVQRDRFAAFPAAAVAGER